MKSSTSGNGILHLLLWAHVLGLPILITLYAYYFRSDTLDFASYGAVGYSLLVVIVGLGLPKYLKTDILVRYFCFLCVHQKLLAPLIFLPIVLGGLLMTFLFGNFIDRVEYISSIKNSSTEVELNSVSIANADVLANAFMLFPDRNEVPFLVYKNSRALDGADNTAFFEAYMKKFVATLNRNTTFRKTLFSDSSHEQGQLFYLYCLTQANYKSNGREEAIDIIANMVSVPLSIQIFHEVLLLEKQSVFSKINTGFKNSENLNDVKRKVIESDRTAIREQILRFDTLIARINNSIDDEVLSVISAHIVQQLFDGKSALIIARILFDENEEDLEKSYDEFLKGHRSVLNLRKSLAESNSVLWFTTPRSMISYQLFEYAAGANNQISQHTVNLINYVSPTLYCRWKRSILNQPAFEKFQDLEFWRFGTPSSLAFRGSGTRRLIEQWMKEDW